MPIYLVLFGSNMDPERNLHASLRRLRMHPDLEVAQVSGVYESPAVLASGELDLDRPRYRNAAILLRTSLDSERLRDELRTIEMELGRVREADKYADRPVDLDIIVTQAENGVTTADRAALEHAHAVLPSAEVAPEWVVGPHSQTLGDLAGGLSKHETLIRRNQ